MNYILYIKQQYVRTVFDLFENKNRHLSHSFDISMLIGRKSFKIQLPSVDVVIGLC